MFLRGSYFYKRYPIQRYLTQKLLKSYSKPRQKVLKTIIPLKHSGRIYRHRFKHGVCNYLSVQPHHSQDQDPTKTNPPILYLASAEGNYEVAAYGSSITFHMAWINSMVQG